MAPRKCFWQVPVGEPLAWLLPALLAGIGHLYAFPKADLIGAGPGVHIVNMDEETIAAQRAWQFVDSLPTPFVLYGLVLLCVCLLCRVWQVRVPYRILLLVALALPGLWYFKVESYLGGKFITL